MSELILIRRGSRLRHDSLLQEFEIAAVGHDAATRGSSQKARFPQSNLNRAKRSAATDSRQLEANSAPVRVAVPCPMRMPCPRHDAARGFLHASSWPRRKSPSSPCTPESPMAETQSKKIRVSESRSAFSSQS